MKKNGFPIDQGHGIAGRYAGLPDPYGSEISSEIVLIPVPFDQTTTYTKGTNKGPKALIEASRNMELYDIETNSEVYLKGIYTSNPIFADSSEEMLHEVYSVVQKYLRKGKFVVTIGGEHSISYAAIKAHSEIYKELTVLQLDAHADFQNTYEGNPWSHACVMARVKELAFVNKIVSVGIRSMSKEELINQENTFFAHNLFMDSKWIEAILERLSENVYITFDVDAFDSSLMPSTGTPEPGGLFWDQTMLLLRNVFKRKSVVGFDVMELCPIPNNPAPDYVVAKLIYKMLSYHYEN